MINLQSTNLGEAIRLLRESKGMTRAALSEAAEISESYLKKIESGIRQPGIKSYQKIVSALGMEIVIRNEENSVKGSCIAKAQEILLSSTEKQAVFITHIMEVMAAEIESVIQ